MKKRLGVLFDLDGVLVLTEPLKAEAHAAAVNRFGGYVSPSFYKNLMGQHHEAVRSAFLAFAGVSIDPERYSEVFREVYQELLESKLETTPGALELVRELADEGYLLAVVSSSREKTVKYILERTGLAEYFKACVSADDVAEKKPAPDAYLMALDRLDISSASAIAIEDSEAGVKAAVNARLPVLALRHSFNLSHDFTPAYAVLDSLLDCRAIIRMIDSLLDSAAA